MNGYQGRMLIVDLTEGKILTESFDEEFARKYIGGVGFGTRLLYNRLAPHLDPLSPLNYLIFHRPCQQSIFRKHVFL
jgi:aldehyde:ferredoxin oxidoreductase